MLFDRIWTEEVTLDAERVPILAFAIHDGHAMRDEMLENCALSDSDRLREEDPFTGGWSLVAPTRVVGIASRFEVDLNRPRDKAVYQRPDDAWGLEIWKRPVSQDMVERSLSEYDEFYAAMESLLKTAGDRYGKFVVFDLHSYNHRRAGPDGPAASPDANPQVNVGTGTMNRVPWAPVVDRFIRELGDYPFPGGPLDVRENIKFKGGFFPRWVHEVFPDVACVLSIEFKKFFMDEWTGAPHADVVAAITDALTAVVPPVLEELASL